MGLLGIEERVSQLGGACRVHSGPGIGTILRVELPFEATGLRSAQQSETDSYSISG
jgi:signal transduction histidine kinase